MKPRNDVEAWRDPEHRRRQIRQWRTIGMTDVQIMAWLRFMKFREQWYATS